MPRKRPTPMIAVHPPDREPPRSPDHANTNTGGSRTVMMAAYGSAGEYARVAAAVAVDTISAYSKRIMLAHNTRASTMAIAMEVIAHGLNISQAGVPVSAASRPPIQNQPGGENGGRP